MTEQRVRHHHVVACITEAKAVRVTRAKVDLRCHAFVLGQASSCRDQMRAAIDSRHSTREARPAGDRPRRNPGAAPEVENGAGEIDAHCIEVLPHHLGELRMLAARLQPRDEHIERRVVELVGDPVYVDRRHGLFRAAWRARYFPGSFTSGYLSNSTL